MEQTNHEEKRADRSEPPAPNSLSREGTPEQAEAQSLILIDGDRDAGPAAHVVLVHPEIPQNTGNIGRSCVATDAILWIVRPIPFRLDERAVRRAGLDYWKFLDLRLVDSWEELTEKLPETPQRRFWYFSRFATRSLWDAQFARGDVLVFGSETAGLPASIRGGAGDRALRLPTTDKVRSLNLSNTVAVGLYEMQRQTIASGVRG